MTRRIYVNGAHSIWHRKTLHIKKLMSGANFKSAVKAKAYITVPLGWDYQEPIPIDVTVRFRLNKKTTQPVISGIKMQLLLNLSYKDTPQSYVFIGRYNDSIKGFSGTYSENGIVKGSFKAVHRKSKN